MFKILFAQTFTFNSGIIGITYQKHSFHVCGIVVADKFCNILLLTQLPQPKNRREP